MTGAVASLRGRPSLTDEVYEAIKAMIMNDVVPPGGRLGIDQLSRDLEVSSTPVRESLVRLESEGLARREALRGYTATALLDRAQVDELFEFRGVIEPWAAARAAQRHSSSDLARLTAEVDSVMSLPSDDSYESYRNLVAHDERFHAQIAAMSGNEQLRAAFERMHCHLHLFRSRYRTGQGSATLAEHRAILQSIAEGKPAAARASMATHLQQAHQRATQNP
jgi:DNA-binding GntR family transcriptional regulator